MRKKIKKSSKLKGKNQKSREKNYHKTDGISEKYMEGMMKTERK